jgi:hypothetical protein
MKTGEVVRSDEAASAVEPEIAVDDREAGEYRRGFGDGIVWASDYATEGELRDLVETGLGRSAELDADHSRSDLMGDKEDIATVTGFESDNPYWQGFIKGVEEAWSTRERPVSVS